MASSALISLYSKKFGSSIIDLMRIFGTTVLETLQFSLRKIRRRIKHGDRLPLPLRSSSRDTFSVSIGETPVHEVLEEILETTFINLHIIEENLQFWMSKAEGSDTRKIYFMIFERGPSAFIGGILQFIQESIRSRSSIRESASMHIFDRIMTLRNLRNLLATFLAEIYAEIERIGEEAEDPNRSLLALVTSVDNLFSNMQADTIEFERLRQINSAEELRDGVNLIRRNLEKLDAYISARVSNCRKPRRTTLNWLRYTCGGIGLSVCCFWLVRHSRIAGSSDMENWIRQGRDLACGFWSDHVEQPLVSIRDELFETFRKRHKGVMQMEEVRLTSGSLHRMLLAFSEETKGASASDQEMLETVMARYEKELARPIQNLLGGELARALLIQIQKLKLDIETAMLELDQILKANEINFAVLAGLPALFVFFAVIMLVRAWLKEDRRAEGRGRNARIQRRLLVAEIERGIMRHQVCVDEGRVRDAACVFGMVLYNLDRLYRAVEKHARASGEWRCLRQDLVELGKNGFPTAYKLCLTSRLGQVYDCLLPSPKPK